MSSRTCDDIYCVLTYASTVYGVHEIVVRVSLLSTEENILFRMVLLSEAFFFNRPVMPKVEKTVSSVIRRYCVPSAVTATTARIIE